MRHNVSQYSRILEPKLFGESVLRPQRKTKQSQWTESPSLTCNVRKGLCGAHKTHCTVSHTLQRPKSLRDKLHETLHSMTAPLGPGFSLATESESELESQKRLQPTENRKPDSQAES